MVEWLVHHLIVGQPDKNMIPHNEPQGICLISTSRQVWANQIQACSNADGERIINHWGIECILSFGLETGCHSGSDGCVKDDGSSVLRNYSAVNKSKKSINSRARISKAWLMANWLSFSKPVVQWCMDAQKMWADRGESCNNRKRQFKCSQRLLLLLNKGYTSNELQIQLANHVCSHMDIA